MNKKFIKLLTDKVITYKEFSICMFIEERMYTGNELADMLKIDRKNMYHSLVNLRKFNILSLNEYTKQYSIKK